MDYMICCPSVKNPSLLIKNCFIDWILGKNGMLHIQANWILKWGTKITWKSRIGCGNSIIGIIRSGCMRVQQREQLLILFWLILFWGKRERIILMHNLILPLIIINHNLISLGNSSFLLLTWGEIQQACNISPWCDQAFHSGYTQVFLCQHCPWNSCHYYCLKKNLDWKLGS